MSHRAVRATCCLTALSATGCASVVESVAEDDPLLVLSIVVVAGVILLLYNWLKPPC